MVFNKETKEKIQETQFKSPNRTKSSEKFEEIRKNNLEYENKIRENQRVSDETLFKRFTI